MTRGTIEIVNYNYLPGIQAMAIWHFSTIWARTNYSVPPKKLDHPNPGGIRDWIFTAFSITSLSLF